MTRLSRCMQALTLLPSLIWSPPERMQSTTGESGQRGSFVEVEGSKLYYEEWVTIPCLRRYSFFIISFADICASNFINNESASRAV